MPDLNLGTGLRMLDQVAPGVAGNIESIITQINTARSAMEGMGSSPMKWAMGISTAIGIATTLIMAGIKQMQEAEEKRQKMFEDGVKNIKEYAEALRDAYDALNALSNSQADFDALQKANQKLADTFPELVVGYDDLGNAILANGDTVKAYTDDLKELIKTQREIIVVTGRNKQADYDKDLQKLQRYEAAMKRVEKTGDDILKKLLNQGMASKDALEMIFNGDVPWWNIFNPRILANKIYKGDFKDELADLKTQVVETGRKKPKNKRREKISPLAFWPFLVCSVEFNQSVVLLFIG